MMEDTDVADRIREGDVHAFRIIVERHSEAAFRLAFRLTGNRHDAEDVVQESLLRAFRRLTDFERRSSFSAWFHRIVVNCCMDVLRRRMRDPVSNAGGDPNDILGLRSAFASPDAEAAGTDLHRQVDAALEQLSPQERVAFVLRHFEGKSIQEISSALNVRLSAAKHSVFRAVRKVREVLEPLLNERDEIHEPH